MNDFVRENLDLSPLKVCAAVLLRLRYLKSTAGKVPNEELDNLSNVLVDVLAADGAKARRFHDIISLLSERIAPLYKDAVCLFHPSLINSFGLCKCDDDGLCVCVNG